MLNAIDLSRVDLNLLVLFEAVIEERHVGRAAARMHLSPSAVSHGLSRLRILLDDPLFLKTPKGVVPTALANELAAPIAEILSRVRGVVQSAAPFDPRTSARRFAIGTPDGVAAVFLPPLLQALHGATPRIDISVRQVLPRAGETAPQAAWRDVFTDLEARAMDVAVVPVDEAPARFAVRTLYEEEFVIAMRARHPYAKAPGLAAFGKAQHLVVSQTGDAFGFLDVALAARGLARRVAATVPNFMLALAMLEQTDLIAALPQRLVALHGARFGIVSIKAPVALPRFKLNMIAPKVALHDAGVAWLIEALASTSGWSEKRRGKRSG